MRHQGQDSLHVPGLIRERPEYIPHRSGARSHDEVAAGAILIFVSLSDRYQIAVDVDLIVEYAEARHDAGVVRRRHSIDKSRRWIRDAGSSGPTDDTTRQWISESVHSSDRRGGGCRTRWIRQRSVAWIPSREVTEDSNSRRIR